MTRLDITGPTNHHHLLENDIPQSTLARKTKVPHQPGTTVVLEKNAAKDKAGVCKICVEI
jgi:hypothetical protein